MSSQDGGEPEPDRQPSDQPVTDPAGAPNPPLEGPAAYSAEELLGPGSARPGRLPESVHALVGQDEPGRPPASMTVTGRRYGIPGMPLSPGHPFYLGFVGALGALLAIGAVGMLRDLSNVLTLIVVALFLALALDPGVSALTRRGLQRGWAVLVVVLAVVAVFAGLISAVLPPLITQATQLATSMPSLVNSLLQSRTLNRLNEQYGIITQLSQELQSRVTNGQTLMQLFGGILGAGQAVVSGVFAVFTVLVLTLYFLASLRTITEAGYRLVPASRRERVRLIGDEIIRRIGGYVAGQIAIATINAFCTFVLVSILGLPYALVLAIVVGSFGLIPLVGATLGALVVILVGLFESWQTGLILVVYYVVYQQVENYLISPRVMARTVAVPGTVAVVAALAGGTLLGLLGALVAIPIAAAVLLVVQEVVIPRQDSL